MTRVLAALGVGLKLVLSNLSLAATLLLETDKSVLEIASDVGYSNSGNFGSAFKRRYGVSPVRYRRNGRSAWPLPEP